MNEYGKEQNVPSMPCHKREPIVRREGRKALQKRGTIEPWHSLGVNLFACGRAESAPSPDRRQAFFPLCAEQPCRTAFGKITLKGPEPSHSTTKKEPEGSLIGSLKWWAEMDSNQRRREPADLQSAPFSHSGIYPYFGGRRMYAPTSHFSKSKIGFFQKILPLRSFDCDHHPTNSLGVLRDITSPNDGKSIFRRRRHAPRIL